MLDRLVNQGKRGIFWTIVIATAVLCLVNIGAAVFNAGVFWIEVSSAILLGGFFIELCGLIKSQG